MKRILILCILMLTALLTAQTQTLTGTKTFTSPPKFKNLQNNNANTKVLTVNAIDVLQWKDASTFVDNNVVLLTGNQTITGIKTFQNIIQLDEPQIQFNNYYSGNYNTFQCIDNSWFFGKNDGGIIFQANPIGFSTNKSGTVSGNFTNLNLTQNRTWDLPDANGIMTVLNNTSPSSSTAIGKIGEIRVTPTHIYVCTATNTWVRTAVSSW